MYQYMFNRFCLLPLLVTIFFVSFAMAASQQGLVGLWQTHDDDGKPTGYVRITQAGAIYTGVIEKGIAGQKQAQYCTACKDERKGQPMLGMVILKNVKSSGDQYLGDEILDPFSGKTYRVKLTLKDGGNKMQVRGFIGLSLFGRTQLWERVQDE